MVIARIALASVAVALTGVVGFTADGAQAGSVTVPSSHGTHAVGFVAPAPHRYGANGMRMGLHCETKDMSTP